MVEEVEGPPFIQNLKKVKAVEMSTKYQGTWIRIPVETAQNLLSAGKFKLKGLFANLIKEVLQMRHV